MNEDSTKPELHKILTEVFRDQEVWDDQGSRVPLDSNVSEQEALVLNAAVLELRPTLSVEVGLAKGISTLAILGSLSQNGRGHHIVMDPFQANYGNAGIELVKRAGLESWWEFHRKFAEEIIPGLDPIQFAFIDASHLFDLTLMEFVLVDKKLAVGGVVGFHDLWMPSLQTLFRYIKRNRNYEIWHPTGFALDPPGRAAGWKSFLRAILGRLPKATSVFSPDFLHPWSSEGQGNLVLLRKLAHDERRWTFHQRF